LSAKEGFPEAEFVKYKNSDLIKQGEIYVLISDIEMFSEVESVQYFLSKIRKKITSIPVILILRSNRVEDVDYEWFFNDFILFPFRKNELEMRILKSLTGKKTDEKEYIIETGKLQINMKEYSVYQDGEKIDFTYKEFELLRFMLENRGQTFSRKELLNKIWGLEYIGGTRTVDVHIRRLRGKLGDDFNSLIETVRNVGYRCIDLQ
jgi:DNA-binding response OmpR family regulator